MLRGREDKVFLLDFFGAEGPRKGGIDVPPSRILTAFPTYPGNTFLGYALDAPEPLRTEKKPEGVIWGKDRKHFKNMDAVLLAASRVARLHSTLKQAPTPALARADIEWHGHLSRDRWRALLRASKFMIGLGDPLLGPSAVDAAHAGAVYIDPSYPTPRLDVYESQHPFLRKALGRPYVCAADLARPASFAACARDALEAPDLAPLLLPELTKDAHAARVRAIFGDYLEPAGAGPG